MSFIQSSSIIRIMSQVAASRIFTANCVEESAFSGISPGADVRVKSVYIMLTLFKGLGTERVTDCNADSFI